MRDMGMSWAPSINRQWWSGVGRILAILRPCFLEIACGGCLRSVWGSNESLGNLWGSTVEFALVALTLFTINILWGKTHQVKSSMVGGGLWLWGNLWPLADPELEHWVHVMLLAWYQGTVWPRKAAWQVALSWTLNTVLTTHSSPALLLLFTRVL